VGGVTQRMYQVQIDDHFEVAVGFVPRRLADPRASLGAYPDTFVQSFRDNGSPDATAKSGPIGHDHGYLVRDLRLSFTPTNGSLGKSAWFVHLVASPSGLVLFQTIAFPPIGEEAAVSRLARRAQSKLVQSVRYP
jgi:hypothetical protein